jgi:mRNA interferase MazF
MHAIHLAATPDGKRRPVVVLTRDNMVPHFKNLTIAAITSTSRTSRTQVPVGPENGLDHESFVNCDDIHTIPKAKVLQRIGRLTVEQEARLSQAIRTAFDLR